MKRNGRPREPTGGAPSPEPVTRITGVAPSLADDLSGRMRRYLVQMSVRVVCFVGAVAIDHWSRWLLLVGAVVLPYIAVVVANAGRERRTDPGTFLPPLGPAALPAGPADTPPAPGGDRP